MRLEIFFTLASLCANSEPNAQLNVVKKPEFQAAQYARSEEDAHGYHHASHNCPSRSVAWRRRLVRPGPLVLSNETPLRSRVCFEFAQGTKATASACTPELGPFLLTRWPN